MGRTSDARERLITSGSALMHERGYTAVGVSEVCSEAGVKKGSFYHFFPSKVELALGVIDRHAAETESALQELVHGEDGPLERLAAYADSVGVGQREIREDCGKVLGCPIGNLALEMSTQEPELRSRLRAAFDRLAASLAGVVEEAVERGELPPQDAGRAGRSILALIEGAVMLAKMKDDPEVLEGLSRDALRLLGAPMPSEL